MFRIGKDDHLAIIVIHGDGTTTGAKKGCDYLGVSGRNEVKGDKAVAFSNRHCNVIAPLVAASGNRNESPLLREALPQLTRIPRTVGLDLREHHGASR